MTRPSSSFEQLAGFHWIKERTLETGWADFDVRRDDVRTAIYRNNSSISAILNADGYKLEQDFYRAIGCRFEDGSFLRLDIPRIVLTNPELVEGVANARTAWLKANALKAKSISAAQRAGLRSLRQESWSHNPKTGDMFIDIPKEGLTRPAAAHFMAVCAKAEQVLQQNGLLAGVHFMYRNVAELRDKGEHASISTLAIKAQHGWIKRIIAP